MRYIKWFIAAAVLLTLTGCPEENPDLVNPPPQTESVYARFINLAGDQEPRTLAMEGGFSFTDIEYKQCTEGVHPPMDSVTVRIKKGETEEIRTPRRVRFVRNTYYTFFVLPTADNSEKPYNPADSLIYIPTTTGLGEQPNISYIKAFNANPDSTVTYTITFGCPNGPPIATRMRYRQFTFLTKVRSGETGISIIRHKDSVDENLGLFRLDLQEQTEYTVLITDGGQGEEESIYILNDYDPTEGAMRFAEPEPETMAFIRSVNVSSANVETLKEPDIFIENLAPYTVGEFREVTACTSLMADSLSAYINGELKSAATSALEVFNRYSLFVFDSLDGDGKLSVLAEPTRLTPPEGMAYVRVIHAAEGDPAITATVLARGDTSELGFQNGVKLSDLLYYGRIGSPVLVKEGLLPLGIFTSGTPSRLLFAATARVEKGKNYVMVISKTVSGEYKIAMIEDEDENQSIDFYEESVYCSFVNMVAGPNYVNFALKSDIESDFSIEEAKFYFSTSLTSIVRSGANTVTIEGQDFNFNAEKGKRILIVAGGEPTDVEYVIIQTDPMGTDLDSYRRRFVNAATSVDNLTVTLHSAEGDVLANNLPYGQASDPRNVTTERKISLVFFNSDTFVTNKSDSLYKMNDIKLAKGKNYSIIFGGMDGSYSALVHQEY